jgi:hypothetical protein
MPVSSLAARWF